MACASFSVPKLDHLMRASSGSTAFVDPVTLDTAFHSGYSAVPRVIMKQMGLTIPAFVNSLFISSEMKAEAGDEYDTCARVQYNRFHGFDLSLHVRGRESPSSGALIQLTGMRCQSLHQNTGANAAGTSPQCLLTEWKPHLSLQSLEDLHDHLVLPGDPHETRLLRDLDEMVLHLSRSSLT